MLIPKIKTDLIIGGISLFLLIFPASVISQTMDLNPDSVFHGTSDAPWFGSGTNIISAQGTIYVITYKQNYPDTRAYGVYVYTIDKNGKEAPYKMGSKNFNYFYYGFPYEGTYYEGIQGNSIAFLFNGQLWHYINQMEDGSILYPAKDSYDCFAMIPIPHTGEPKTYFYLISGAPAVIKKGAFQHDSTLYFLGIYAKSSDPNYKKWCLQKYTYNKSQNKFSYNSTIPMTNIYGDRFGGFVEHIDATGRHRLILNTYMYGQNSSALGYLDATTSGNQTTFTYTLSPGVTEDGAATVVVGGSIKGCRTTAQVTHKEIPERFTVFSLYSDKSIKYIEYYFFMDNIAVAGSGNIVLPSTLTPHTVDNEYNIQGTFELIPTAFHSNVTHTPDGFKQNNWIYYPDKNRKICGTRFLSDSWQFIPDSTVSSTDLSSDSIYGPQVRSLWTLTGIVDGGPPCSINWPVWTDPLHHTTKIKPTSLKFVQTSVSKTEVTTTSDEQYTLGAEFKTDFKSLNFGLETKFSDTYKNTVSKSTTIKNEITKTYELTEEGQEMGYYIYSVPSITRYMYQVYPWWDNSFAYPKPNTVQYRFVVTGTALLNRSRPLSDFPFLVDEPNSTNLADWKHSGRTYHQSALLSSGLQPVCTPTWSSPNPGDVGSFEKITDSITEYEHKTSYSIDATFSGKKPEVFEGGVSIGTEVSYSTSTTNETEMGTKLEVSLENLTEASLGVNFSEYVLETYWFKPEDFKWWFYDSLGTERPWYIAYLVNSTQGKVALVSPDAEENAGRKGKVFSWSSTGFEPREYTLFLSKSQHVSPSSTVLRLNAGISTDYYVPQLPSDIKTLYWAVMAVTDEGDIVWSESRPLVLEKEEIPDDPVRNLTAIPYPNPGNGTGIHLLLDTKETGSVIVRIMAVNGTTVYQSVLVHPGEGPQTYEFSQLSLSRGIYVMEVTIKNERVVKKLTVY